MQKGLDGEPEVLLDPNTFSADGTSQLAELGAHRRRHDTSPTASPRAARTGTMPRHGRRDRKTLPDELKWVKVSDIAWQNDGFFYSRYDEPTAGKELTASNDNHKVYYHRLGTPQAADELVFEDPQPAALPHRGHDRRRAVRDPRRLRARQGQGRQRACSSAT